MSKHLTNPMGVSCRGSCRPLGPSPLGGLRPSRPPSQGPGGLPPPRPPAGEVAASPAPLPPGGLPPPGPPAKPCQIESQRSIVPLWVHITACWATNPLWAEFLRNHVRSNRQGRLCPFGFVLQPVGLQTISWQSFCKTMSDRIVIKGQTISCVQKIKPGGSQFPHIEKMRNS